MYVKLTIEYNGFNNYDLENEIISKEFYDKNESVISTALESVTYPDLDGKHGHVSGELSVETISSEEAAAFVNSGEYVGFIARGDDVLSDELSKELYDDFCSDNKKSLQDLSNLVSKFNLSVNLAQFENKDEEKRKVEKLLKENGYELI